MTVAVVSIIVIVSSTSRVWSIDHHSNYCGGLWTESCYPEIDFIIFEDLNVESFRERERASERRRKRETDERERWIERKREKEERESV